ncbi:GGDEF domain-containing protein [Paraglaciecola aquimarina]|uniref:diguanylate cyclase n=1 Tax=Paraglaciecola aquimarina TaxID=1235557 RepID=A0ABU3SUW7_9ALTE|nr:GGDEF domain-containing protein [Paraglaciecola aquimarina]MDU0353793.1 GGDEF domain-containing protein [Paraglaciecola aquimarina]
MIKAVTTNLGWLKFIAFLVTIALVIFYDYIPTRTLQLHPQLGNNTHIIIDNNTGSDTEFAWIDREKYEWTCTFNTNKGYPFCNIAISWSHPPYEQLDLSSYSYLLVDLEYVGDAKYISLFIRNYYQYGSDEDEIKTGKFNNVTKAATFYEQVLPIYFDQLRVADWWVNEFQVPPELVMPDVSQTISMGLGIPHPVTLGTHRFRLHSITAKGAYVSREHLYFTIIIFWAILALAEILYKYAVLNRKYLTESNLLSKMAEQNQLYKMKAETDKLTCILNREGISQITKKLQEQGILQQYALLVLDLDYFKQINDSFGHAIGDSVLKDVAQIITSCKRSYDLVARWGGEEFVVLFHCLDNEQQFVFAEKIRKAIESASYDVGEKTTITASIGVTRIKKSTSLEQAFLQADQALYYAKGGGRNRVVIFKEEQ